MVLLGEYILNYINSEIELLFMCLGRMTLINVSNLRLMDVLDCSFFSDSFYVSIKQKSVHIGNTTIPNEFCALYHF